MDELEDDEYLPVSNKSLFIFQILTLLKPPDLTRRISVSGRVKAALETRKRKISLLEPAAAKRRAGPSRHQAEHPDRPRPSADASGYTFEVSSHICCHLITHQTS
jgi:hypothetical protein